MNPSQIISRSLLVVALAVAPQTSLGAQDRTESSGPEVETVGTGERRVAPDRAILHLQIETKAQTASAVAAANARVHQRVQDTLKAMGLENAVTTASYNVGPNWEQGPRNATGPQRDGYIARTVLRVQLTKLNDIGRVIDATLAKGATGVEGVMFDASTALDARRGALADAAAAARADAEALARAMGGTLGPLISTSTAGSDDPRRANLMMRRFAGGMGMGGDMTSATGITPNEIVIGAGVVARWRFIPGR